MKVFLIFTVICLHAATLVNSFELTEEHKTKARAHFEKCVKQEKVPEDDANRLRKKDFSNPSSSMKCFGACFFEKVGALKDNQIEAKVVLQKLGAIIGEEKTKEVLQKCKDIKGSDRCDTGFQIYKCLDNFKANLVA